ncbi:MAG: tRNA (cytidine(56)-2'-O)-methyltransferase, partial [Thermoplasmata archaeon]|nr:tRNA (cytidine(56)-2'-O)-methyltransferase [Thermoplasmata archaeon]
MEPSTDWRATLRSFDGTVVHLTMYGEALSTVAPRLRRRRRLLVVVGGAKVPPALYGLADMNVAIGHQPHSEVAALAVFLARLKGVPRPGPWPGGRAVFVPLGRGQR